MPVWVGAVSRVMSICHKRLDIVVDGRSTMQSHDVSKGLLGQVSLPYARRTLENQNRQHKWRPKRTSVSSLIALTNRGVKADVEIVANAPLTFVIRTTSDGNPLTNIAKGCVLTVLRREGIWLNKSKIGGLSGAS